MQENIRNFMIMMANGYVDHMRSFVKQGFPLTATVNTEDGPRHMLEVCYQFWGHAVDFSDETIQFLLDQKIDPNFKLTYDMTETKGDFLVMAGMTSRSKPDQVPDIMRELYLQGYKYDSNLDVMCQYLFSSSDVKSKFINEWEQLMIFYCFHVKNIQCYLLCDIQMYMDKKILN
jgi:hypothetical protein